MSEMLANHYFLVRNFLSAKTIFENIISKDSTNKLAAKKLIVCYITSGETDKAINLFLSIIKSDIDFIISTDIKADDCPCPDIISGIEKQSSLFNNEIDRAAALGMLWLYCSLEKSIEFFKQAEVKNPNEIRFREINSILMKRLIPTKPNSIN